MRNTYNPKGDILAFIATRGWEGVRHQTITQRFGERYLADARNEALSQLIAEGKITVQTLPSYHGVDHKRYFIVDIV